MKSLEELCVSEGDWTYDPDIKEVEDDNQMVAIITGENYGQYRGENDDEITDANGRLIAASKVMYEALLAAECAVAELCVDQDPANECWETLRKVRAAIAKAGGA